MTIAEASDYIEGQDRRCRSGWEQSRFISTAIFKSFTGEVPDITLPWDENSTDEDEEVTDDAIAALRQAAAEMQARINSGELQL